MLILVLLILLSDSYHCKAIFNSATIKIGMTQHWGTAVYQAVKGCTLEKNSDGKNREREKERRYIKHAIHTFPLRLLRFKMTQVHQNTSSEVLTKYYHKGIGCMLMVGKS